MTEGTQRESVDPRRAQYDWLRAGGVAPLEALASVYGPRPLPATEQLLERRWVRLKIISEDLRDSRAIEAIWSVLQPWMIEDTDGWGDWVVTLVWPGDRERAEGWGRSAEEARQMATVRLFRAGWRPSMPIEAAARLLEEYEIVECKEATNELSETLGPPEVTPDVLDHMHPLHVARYLYGDSRRGLGSNILHAADVEDGMLVRDSSGDYLLRFGAFAHVAFAIGVRPWRAWSLPLMRWPRTGQFELVARGLSKETPAEEMRAAAEKFERVAGVIDVYDPLMVTAGASTTQEQRDSRPSAAQE